MFNAQRCFLAGLMLAACGSTRAATTHVPPSDHGATVGDFQQALLEQCGAAAPWCALWTCPEGSEGRQRVGGPEHGIDGCIVSTEPQLDTLLAGSVVRSITVPLYVTEHGLADLVSVRASGIYGPPRMVVLGTMEAPLSTLSRGEVATSFREPGGSRDIPITRWLFAFRQLPQTGFLGSLAALLENPAQQIPGFHMPTREEFNAAFEDALPPNSHYARLEACANETPSTIIFEVAPNGDVRRTFSIHADPAIATCLQGVAATAHLPVGPSWFAIVL